ncbi:ATP-binding protein [Tautonia sp. JC769]|uniref:PAS domain-containing hybrid sensor histidine kinase/response regulator n=1 Tax=Tautonia sp. JC769 TaxID=3232135 RepID=UPI0034596D2F
MPVEAYLKLIDRLPEAHLLVSGDGVVLGANRRLARLGFEPQSLRSRPLSAITAQPPEAVSAYLRRCARTSEPVLGSLGLRRADGEVVACRSDGSVVDPASDLSEAVILLRLVPKGVSVSRFLTLNQKIEQLGREISFRKKAEEELREQKEWLGVTLSSIGDAVIATDTEGRVLLMNPVAERLTGWAEAEASCLPLDEVFRIINETSRETVESPVTKCLREGVVVGLANHTLLISRDGTEYAIDDSAAPIREPGGQVKGVVLVFHDVGDRRKLERELHARAERLAENDRRKDEFLAMLAHELRNPLASINHAVQLFDRLNSDGDLEWAREVVQRQVKHLARLIDDLLNVSRLSWGKISLRKEPLRLSPVVGTAVEAVRPLLEERSHELSIALAEDDLRLEADPLRLEQILVNLLTNAAKYTDAGGRVSLAARREPPELVITVRDTGMGITPDLMPRIFDLFTQGDRTIARSEGGLGIGLTLVQKLVEMHGGTVTAASDGPGKGSEFVVRLPALEPSAAEETRPKEPATRADRQGARVLIVDDNVDTVTALARILKLLGHDVQLAYDGPSALEMARSHCPEIVLLDIGLPGMDGYEVVRRLRGEEGCRTSLIIAASGYGQDQDRLRSLEAGFDHHLVKPVDFESLMNLFDLRTSQGPPERPIPDPMPTDAGDPRTHP